MGGFKVQGKDMQTALKMVTDAKKLEAAGAFAIVLECIPWLVARLITNLISIPHDRHRSGRILRWPGPGLP